MSNRMKAGCLIALACALDAQAALANNSVLIVDPDKSIRVDLNGRTLQVELQTGSADRLTLHPETVKRLAILPTAFTGKAHLAIGPTRLLTGYNQPARFTVEGAPQRARIFWFSDASGRTGDGSIGPWAIPHDRVSVPLGGPQATLHRFPLLGSTKGASATIVAHDGGQMALTFAVESKGRYPLASAAAGAAIARAYDGVATDEVWQEPIGFGVMRPVRLVRLGRPLVIGPFRFDAIAVRVRDRLDGWGAGDRLPRPPSPDDDPSEIIVTASSKKGPKPIFSFRIGRTALKQCSLLEYVKSVKEIRLSC